jgi:dipeptidase E
MNLLLLSNSTSDAGYLAHALGAIAEWSGPRRRAAFLPFAGVTRNWDEYARLVQQALAPLGIDVAPVHRSDEPVRAVREAELLMVGGGNTFHLLHHTRRLGLLAPLREAVLAGTPFLGWSAGSNLACPTICTTNDMPIIDPGGLDALSLVPFQINPHYTNALPSGLRGETRNQRLAEFNRVNPDVPVLGMPEGDWVQVKEGKCTLHGPHAAWWFHGASEPRSVAPGPLALP